MNNTAYIADTLLLDKLYWIDCGAKLAEQQLIKQAGAADLLGSLSSSVMQFGKSHIDTNSVGSVMGSLAELLVPAVLFKINPVLGVLEIIASQMGFDVTAVVKNLIRHVYQSISSGSLPTLSDLNEVGKSAVSTQAGDIEATSMFEPLYSLQKKGQLVRVAIGRATSIGTLPTTPFFGGQGNIVSKIFGNLFERRAKGKAMWLMGGFVVWIVKTLLLGAGLVAGAEAIHGFLGGKKEPATSTKPIESTEPAQSTHIALTPTGRGQDVHQNDHQESTWLVPLVNGSIESTLIAWAEDIYKELAGKEQQMRDNHAFHVTVDMLRSGLESDSNKLAVPEQFKSRKQIVDRFAPDVANAIAQTKKAP